MTDSDTILRDRLKLGQNEAEQGLDRGFDAAWASAELQASAGRGRGRWAGAAAVAALAVVITVASLLPAEQDWQFVNPTVFEGSTSWVAPSDVLLPEHQFDIFNDIPVLIESTKTEEGALL